MPTSGTDTTPAQALRAVREYFVHLDLDRAQFRDWVGGSVFGGPNGNGTYPLTDFTNNTSYIKCPARIIADVGGGGGGGGGGIVSSDDVEYGGHSLTDTLDDRIAELTAATASIISQAATIVSIGAATTSVSGQVTALNGLLGTLRTDHDGLAAIVTTVQGLVASNDTTIRALITTEASARTTADSAFAATVALVGAVAGGGTAFILNVDTVKVSPSITLGQRFTTIFAITDALDAAITSETSARVTAVSAEASARNTLAATLRTETDTKVAAGVATEASARVTGDAAEASARTTLAATLRSETAAAILTEQNARANADAAEATARTDLAATLRSEAAALISTEQTARVAGDSAEASTRTALAATLRAEALATITDEQTARVAGDGALSDRLTIVEASSGSDVAALTAIVDARIATEATARTNADTALGSRIDSVEATRQTAGQVATIVNAAVTTEANARVTADAAEASERTDLTARVTNLANEPGYYGSNQGFDDFPASLALNQLPPRWDSWDGNGAGLSRVSDLAGGYALRMTTAAAAKGIKQTQRNVQAGWHVLVIDFTLIAGDLVGASIPLRFYDSNDIYAWDANIAISSLEVNGIAIGFAPGAGTYRTRTMIYVPSSVTGSPYAYNDFYVIGDGYGGNSAKTVDWLFTTMRPATQGEIDGHRALADTLTLFANATIETNARINADTAEANSRVALAASVPGQISAAVATEATARSSADGAIAANVTSLSTTVGGHTAALSAYGSSISGLQLKYGVTLDVNGYVTGFESNNGGGTSDFVIRADKFKFVMPGYASKVVFGLDARGALLDGDLNVNNGKIIFNNGTYMKVQGLGFGTTRQFLEWFGPTMATNLCSEANAVQFLKTNGDAYFGGSLASGILRNAGTTTDTVSTAQIKIGPFSSNGHTKTIIVSAQYEQTYFCNAHTGGISGSGGGTITIERQVSGGGWVSIGTLNLIDLERTVEVDGDPAVKDRVDYRLGGSTTLTDNTVATSAMELRATLSGRSLPGLAGAGIILQTITQFISIIETES